MEPWHLAHLIALSAWAGLVLGEGVLELSARGRNDALRLVATAHFWIDVLVEIPLIAAVLVTGTWLTLHAPLDRLHVLKIAAALVAIGINVYCAVEVVRRHLTRDDVARVAQLSVRVRRSGLGVPFALVAAYVGLRYFRA